VLFNLPENIVNTKNQTVVFVFRGVNAGVLETVVAFNNSGKMVIFLLIFHHGVSGEWIKKKLILFCISAYICCTKGVSKYLMGIEFYTH